MSLVGHMQDSARAPVVSCHKTVDGWVSQLPCLATVQVATLALEQTIAHLTALKGERCTNEVGTPDHVALLDVNLRVLLQIRAYNVSKVADLCHPFDGAVVQHNWGACSSLSSKDESHRFLRIELKVAGPTKIFAY